MLKNHCKTLKICLFGQTTKQPLSNPENIENASNLKAMKAGVGGRGGGRL